MRARTESSGRLPRSREELAGTEDRRRAVEKETKVHTGLTLALGDRQEWAAHEGDPGATPFHSWDWLAWIAPVVECRFVPLMVRRGSTSVGLAPLLLRRHYLGYTANLVPFPVLGPVVPSTLLQETAALVRRWAIRHRVGRLQLTVYPTPEETAGALSGAGFEEQPVETFLVDLQRPTLQETFDSFNKDVRNALRRSTKNGVTIRDSTPQDLRVTLPRIHREVLGELTPYTSVIGAGLAATPPPLPVFCRTAVVDGQPVGAAVCVGGTIAMGWLVGVFPEARGTEASSALIWDAITWAQEAGSAWLDMGTAPTPGNAAFKRKFRPVVLTGARGSWQLPGTAAARRVLRRGPRIPVGPEDHGG